MADIQIYFYSILGKHRRDEPFDVGSKTLILCGNTINITSKGETRNTNNREQRTEENTTLINHMISNFVIYIVTDRRLKKSIKKNPPINKIFNFTHRN